MINRKMFCSKEGCDSKHKALGYCGKHYMEQKRANNPEQKARDVLQVKAWRESNKDKLAAQQQRYGQKHRKRLSESRMNWKRDNWEYYKSYLAARKDRVKQVTPKWADLDAIEAFYYNRPEGYHVDHIIPINGVNVTGLHIIDNLQYLLASDNLKKSNKV